ncbi:MAG: type I DNA topoisomerase [Bacilli bacterium]|nr:type I DNA topoisomerase [Bacilli bacterium]
MKLVIVESPAKTHTIGTYLGSGFKVVSSKGHIRDLSTTGKYGLGVNVEGDFEPNYIPIPGKKKDINALKKDIKECDFVYLATDPDREGEAISWHLYDALGIKDEMYDRIVFNEITEGAVKEAFNHARKIDYDLVKSQETRRILDRIIGFRLSKLMQSKTGGKSAGRVQSVALKLIVDREREIEAFVPEEYWTITAHFPSFDSNLEKYKTEKIELHTEDDVQKVLESLSNDFKIESIEQKEKNRSGVMPFTTSTLQQACINKFNYNSSKVMSIAQKLYEGINLGSETVGLITYMRTDSTRLSPVFINDTFEYIKSEFGNEYVGAVKKGKKKENVQDAHEAIRPTSIHRTPESVKKYLSSEEYKIYSIIYARALASLMKDAKVLATTVILDNNDYKFKTTGQILIFDGFLRAYKEYSVSNDVILPDFNKFNGIVSTDDIETEQKFTKPVSRYTEATLIEEMESLGIGRPSTYATTMKTLKDRDYVLVQEKKFHPTEMGIETTDKLQEFFSNIINVEYTAEMETDLDKIAEDNLDNIKVLKAFYNEFEPLVKKAFTEMEKKAPKLTGEKCPECDSDLVIRRGKYGEFTACSNYPECKYIKQEKKEIVTICKCPKCDGDIIEKKTRRGKVFYGCNKYPKCDVALWDEPTGELCPECNSLLVNKKDGVKCSSCEYTK